MLFLEDTGRVCGGLLYIYSMYQYVQFGLVWDYSLQAGDAIKCVFKKRCISTRSSKLSYELHKLLIMSYHP